MKRYMVQEGSKVGGLLVQCETGGLVLHSDHAAELARVEDDLLKMNNLAYEWRVRAERAEAYVAGQDVRSDFQTAGVMRMALDAVTKTLATASHENTLLRAECEAWRAITLQPGWTGTMPVGHMVATDAAGILRKLPQASDFEGDGRVDITGGEDSADYVRDMRDGAKGAE